MTGRTCVHLSHRQNEKYQTARKNSSENAFTHLALQTLLKLMVGFTGKTMFHN